jgi:O-antigen/teichoic acid export membrane protein
MGNSHHHGSASGSPPTGLVEPLPGAADSALEASADDTSSELNVHSHLSQLFGRDSIYLLLWALQLGLAAVVTPLATRLLGTESFGAVVAANAVMQILFVVVCLGLSTGVEKRFFQPGGPEEARRLVTLSILLAVVFTAAVAGTGSLWCRSLGFSSYTPALQYAVLWAGVSGVTAVGLSLLRSQDRLLPFSIVSLLQSVVAEVTSLALVVWWAPTPAHFILGQLLAQLVAIAWVLGSVRPALPRRSDLALAGSTLRYTIPLVPAALSSFALTSADRLIVQKQLGEVEVARYQIAYNIGSIPILLLALLSGAWMPRFFSLGGSADRGMLLAAARDALFRLLIPVTLGLSLGAPLVLRVWAPPSYHPDRLLVVLFLVVISSVPFAAGLSAIRVLLMTGQTTAIAVASLVAAAANIGLNIVMVSAYGLAGAAGATLLSYALLHLLLEMRARVALPTPRSSMRLVAGLLVSVAGCWGLALVPQTPVFQVIRGVGAAACLTWFVVSARRLSRSKKTPGTPAAVATT